MKVHITKSARLAIYASSNSYTFETSLSAEVDLKATSSALPEGVVDDIGVFEEGTIPGKIRTAGAHLQALCIAEVEDDVREYAEKDANFKTTLELRDRNIRSQRKILARDK